MKKLFAIVILAFFASTLGFASGNPMKPGLWEVHSKFITGAGEFDPQAEMKKAMAGMPAEQRKQMEAMLAKSGMHTTEKGVKVCYTQEMLDQKNYGNQTDKKCDPKIKEESATKFSMTFKCEDGSTGSGEWNITSATTYTGKMAFTEKSGKKMKIEMNSKFLSADCGDVKPAELPRKK